jgi:hypothetical protein
MDGKCIKLIVMGVPLFLAEQMVKHDNWEQRARLWLEDRKRAKAKGPTREYKDWNLPVPPYMRIDCTLVSFKSGGYKLVKK